MAIKIVLFVLVFVLSFAAFSRAEVYVVYKTDTKEVLSVSPEDDAVVESGYSKEILPGATSDYPLEENVQDYKMTGKRFVLNTKKISDRENEKEAGEAKETKRQADLDSAKVKLMALGLTSAEVNAFVR